MLTSQSAAEMYVCLLSTLGTHSSRQICTGSQYVCRYLEVFIVVSDAQSAASEVNELYAHRVAAVLPRPRRCARVECRVECVLKVRVLVR